MSFFPDRYFFSSQFNLFVEVQAWHQAYFPCTCSYSIYNSSKHISITCSMLYSFSLLWFLRLALTLTFFDRVYIFLYAFAPILSCFFLCLQGDRRDEVEMSNEVSWILSQTSERLLEFHFICLRSIHVAFDIHALLVWLTNKDLVGTYFYVVFLFASFYHLKNEELH